MRTTVTLDPDVLAAVEEIRRRTGSGLSDAVNDLARRGLSARERPSTFVQRRTSLGRQLVPLDDVSGALDALEGPSRRE